MTAIRTICQMAEAISQMTDDQQYVIFRNQFYDDANELSQNMRALQTRLKTQSYSIFQQPNVNDKKRRMLEAAEFAAKETKIIGRIHTQLLLLFKEVGNGRSILSPAAVLQSLRDCMEQRLHRDFNFAEKPVETIQSFLVITALQRNTKLVIYTKRGGKQTIYLNVGDVFIGRGDLIHAGGGYESQNIRIHWYVDFPNNLREPGKTYVYDVVNDIAVQDDYYDKSRAAKRCNAKKARIAKEIKNDVKEARRNRIIMFNKRNK